MKKVLIKVGIAFFVLSIIAYLLFSSSSSTEIKDSFETGKQQAVKNLRQESQPVQVVYSMEVKATSGEKNKITVTGTTNLPDGSLLDVYVYRLVYMQGDSKPRTSAKSRGIEKATVFEGKFVTDIAPRDDLFSEEVEVAGYQIVKISPDVRVEVVLDPLRADPEQKPEVIQSVGNLGEKLKTSPQLKVIGEKTDNPYYQLFVMLDFSFPFSK